MIAKQMLNIALLLELTARMQPLVADSYYFKG